MSFFVRCSFAESVPPLICDPLFLLWPTPQKAVTQFFFGVRRENKNKAFVFTHNCRVTKNKSRFDLIRTDLFSAPPLYGSEEMPIARDQHNEKYRGNCWAILSCQFESISNAPLKKKKETDVSIFDLNCCSEFT